MKVLFIYHNRIHEKTGGSLESIKIYKTLESLEKKGILTLDSVSLENDFINKNVFNIFTSRLFFHSTYFYCSWQKIKNKYLNSNYDLIIIGNSRLGFVAKDFKKTNPNIKIIIQFHNIEYDYTKMNSKKFTFIMRFLYNIFEINSCRKDEKESVKNSDMCLFMTKKDESRCRVLYSKYEIKSYIIPICILEDKNFSFSSISGSLNLVFIGSLNYSENIDILKKFLKNVWINLQSNNNLKLYICGSSPNESLKNDIAMYNNIITHYNYDTLSNLLPLNSLLLSPSISSVGMKTKIAYALSYGLPILGSNNAFLGYENIFDDIHLNEYIKIATDYYDFIKHINDYINLDINEWNKSNQNSKELWNKYYNFDNVEDDLNAIFHIIFHK